MKKATVALVRPSAVLLTCVLAAAGCGGAHSRLASHIERGKAYYAQGDYAHASVEFRNALQIAPKDVGTRLLQAHTSEKLGQFRDSAALYQSVLELQPDNVDAQANLGRLETFGGAPEIALKTIAPGLTVHPDTAALLAVRAMARTQLNDMEGATADADRALQLAPKDEDTIALRAGLYERAGDFDKAQALVGDALKGLPKSLALREVMLSLALHQKEFGQAEEQLHALIQLKPDELRYRQQLALLYAHAHRLDDAQQVLEDLIRVAPDNAAAKLALVSFLNSQRSRELGEKKLREFIAREPANYDLRFGLADLQLAGNDTPAALATYREIQTRAGKEPQGLLARDRIANLELNANHDAQAQQIVDEVLRANPRDAEALLLRGKLALRRKDPGAAIADLRILVRDQPTSVPLQQLLAGAYVANGDLVLAEQTLRSALEVDPTNAQARIQLADVLLKTKHPETAVSMLEEAVRRYPTDVLPRQALINAYLVEHDFPAAQRAADDLKTLAPKEAASFYLAGLAAQAQNQLDAAQSNFEQALKLSPRAGEPLTALAQLYLARHQGPKAVALVQQSVAATESKDPVPLNLLGEVYLTTKDFPHALEALTKATQLAPQWWPAQRNLALAHIATNDPTAAVAAYKAALATAPHEPQVVLELGRLYEQRGEVEQAIALYESNLKYDPKNELFANNLAMLLVTYKSSRADLDRARALTAGFDGSKSGSLLDTAGWVRVKLGEYAEALPVLERAKEVSPDSKEIRYHLAVAQLHSGQQAQARANLEAALTGAGSTRWADDARAALAGLKNQTG